MSLSDQTVPVNLLLPKQLYERVARAAAQEHRGLEELLSVLVAEGMDVHATAREVLEQVASQYRARICGEDGLSKPSGAVLQELSELRKAIVASGEPILDWEEIERVVSERRGAG
jgi:hypothetical protein